MLKLAKKNKKTDREDSFHEGWTTNLDDLKQVQTEEYDSDDDSIRDLSLSSSPGAEHSSLHSRSSSNPNGMETNYIVKKIQSGAYPRISVVKTKESVKIGAHIPGVSPSDVSVSVDKAEQFLTITGKLKKEGMVLATFKKVFKLPSHADTAKLFAKYHIPDQTLNVVVPIKQIQ